MNYIDVAASRELASALGFSPDDPHCRKSIEAQLEAMLDRQFELITLLDLMGADADLEDGGDDEPSFGVEINEVCELEAEDEHGPSWTEASRASAQCGWVGDDDEDADFDEDSDAWEEDDPAGGDHSDFEPSLGSPEIGPSAWYRSTAGFHFVDGSQEHWADGEGDDREFVNEDGDHADYAA